jgi:ADP-ribose pyrophosphatase YjhB (NUDIX family)
VSATADRSPPRGPFVGAGVVVVRDGRVLVGLRHGSHGEGTWGFPGGKVDPGEDPVQTARRELLEETGLTAERIEPITWTNDVMETEGLHFVTLHHRAWVASGEPRVLEADKVREWRWVGWNAVPEPVFGPSASLLATAWRPG